jgi:energy-coupling factor transporter ATP-binding protein EcfA2
VRVLETTKLSFAYDDGTTALRDLTMTLDDGEKVAILGPNGAGKSTLLHLLSGFRMPFDGTVAVCGRKLEQQSADDIRRDLGLLFQDPDDQLFMPTVEEDVAFGPRTLKLDDIEGRVLRGLRSTGIEHLAKRRPHRLSHGMKKRAAIAGILAMDPRVLLLDEPTSGLDPKSRSELVRLLKSMDRTMLIATHDLEAAAEIVDRAIVLNVGVVKEGTIRDIVTDSKVMEEVGLELPAISRLFKELDSMGYPVEALPVSMDQAVAELTKVIDRVGRQARSRGVTKTAGQKKKT